MRTKSVFAVALTVMSTLPLQVSALPTDRELIRCERQNSASAHQTFGLSKRQDQGDDDGFAQTGDGQDQAGQQSGSNSGDQTDGSQGQDETEGGEGAQDQSQGQGQLEGGSQEQQPPTDQGENQQPEPGDQTADSPTDGSQQPGPEDPSQGGEATQDPNQQPSQGSSQSSQPDDQTQDPQNDGGAENPADGENGKGGRPRRSPPRPDFNLFISQVNKTPADFKARGNLNTLKSAGYDIVSDGCSLPLTSAENTQIEPLRRRQNGGFSTDFTSLGVSEAEFQGFLDEVAGGRMGRADSEQVEARKLWNNDFSTTYNKWASNPSIVTGIFSEGFNFRPACEKHDFGYRNAKYFPEQCPSESAKSGLRKQIDDSFWTDMSAVCRTWNIASRVECWTIAFGYWGAVRAAGWQHFKCG